MKRLGRGWGFHALQTTGPQRSARFGVGTGYDDFRAGVGLGCLKEESRRIFDAYVEAGGNFIDTANRYTDGTSERFVGEFISADRGRFVVATKYTLYNRRDDPNATGTAARTWSSRLKPA